ncbi:TonB-dependent receptor plug domain-containing protein [Phenylobacterium kunshanense]|uniref:TonB-dependent receptor n=1 Tax=Phenylobacterium kunshanense TaxID=1445034 RepID=A0A328BJ65_9CAUL|nr:TonB-dependent receptor [Phenylobacterium kunshanense]RAK66451.1 TonB-dependent receptor [Phenylobacterium kunshanense]
MKKTALFAVASMATLLAAAQARAADAVADAEADRTKTVEELVVTGEITFRNRTDEAAPTLSYDLEYFQRFEPLTAGDAMKRVPSVAFLSDVLESDGARLRGLDPGYTQILINGERVPGAGVDRSFFVDRIPAELIERVEVVRSSSANRSGDAMAGALNIVLRDGYTFDGGYVRAGALMFSDDRVRETVGGVFSAPVGPGRMVIGANYQGRRNPKQKFSQRFDEPGGTLDNIEIQSDKRNGEDYSLNASYDVQMEDSTLKLSGYFVRTDRLEDEDSYEYRGGRVGDADFLTYNDNNVDIQTDNWALQAKYERNMAGGKTRFKLGYAELSDDQDEIEEEYEYLRDTRPFPDDDRFTGDLTRTRLKDKEVSGELSHKRDIGAAKLEFGVQASEKNRDTDISAVRNRVTIPNPPATRPALGAYGPLVAVVGGLNAIEERRIDPFVMVSGGDGPMVWEAGLRWENTDTTIEDATAPAASRKVDNDYSFLLPSAHLRWNLSADDRVKVSVARTVRRPNFDFLSPALLEAELGDNDLLGNPNLKPETAWGIDVGFERRLGSRGVAGVNVFYRDVKDLIEVASTGQVGSEGAGTFVLQPRNTGDGSVWGVEFDLSTSLSAFGLDDTGVFLNYSWLDSDVDDEFGSRRFNDQAKYVFNVGFIQDLPDWAAAFGATYRKQGKAFGRVVGEEVTTTYGADLEIFVEKRFGERYVVRLTGTNLLDSKKKETFNKFTTIADQRSRDFDEYELEREEAGPVFQLVARATF